MPKITATFPDGTTFTYKGNRNVLACWRYKMSDGSWNKGWSLDTDKAIKTARNNVRQYEARLDVPALPRGRLYAHQVSYFNKVLREKGLRSISELRQYIAEKRDAAEAQATIEVVPTSLADIEV